MPNTPFSFVVSRAEVRGALAHLDALARQGLTPRGLAGVPAQAALFLGLDAVPPWVGAVIDTSARILDASEPVTITATLGAQPIAIVEVR